MDQPREMVEMNGLIQRAFRMHHGRDAHLELPRWWADRVREVVAALDPYNKMSAGRLWACLSRREQQDLVLEHVGILPKLLTTPRGLEWLKRLSTVRQPICTAPSVSSSACTPTLSLPDRSPP